MSETIGAKAIAVRLRRTVAAITKAARKGTFRKTARQDERGRWWFDWPAAGKAFTDNTDPSRLQAKHLEPADADVVVFESERGRFEISADLHAKLQAAAQDESADLLTPEMVAALDRILFITTPAKESP